MSDKKKVKNSLLSQLREHALRLGKSSPIVQSSKVAVLSEKDKIMDALSTYSSFQTLRVTTPKEFVRQVEITRPEKRNAMNNTFFKEFRDCFTTLATDKDCRVVIISGAGKIFSAGLDLKEAALTGENEETDPARKFVQFKRVLTETQESFSVIEKCPKPVIVAIHSACVGGGVDLASACDIRYCTEDAWFQIKEVDIGITADLGTLQRFPKIIGNDSICRELTYTARKMFSKEAKELGFIGKICADKEEMVKEALKLAEVIAKKSPVAVQGSKVNLIYARDHNVPESLEYMATWNAAMIQSEDVVNAVTAAFQKKIPVFSKL